MGPNVLTMTVDIFFLKRSDLLMFRSLCKTPSMRESFSSAKSPLIGLLMNNQECRALRFLRFDFLVPTLVTLLIL